MSQQPTAKWVLQELGITPTCRFGPHKYETLELWIADVLDSQWLAADEWQPEPDKPVLTYDATSGKQVVAWWWEAGGRWLSAGKMTHVTHWQPLPAPPKDEDEEEE